jgi:hypothetical protein
MLSAPVRQQIVQGRTLSAMRQFDMRGQNVTACPLSTLIGSMPVAQRSSYKNFFDDSGVTNPADFPLL